MQPEEQLDRATIHRLRKQGEFLLTIYRTELSKDPSSRATKASRSNLIAVQHSVRQMYGEAVARELALIKVNSTTAHQNEIIELGHLFGAHALDVDQETVTLEVTGSADKIEKLVTLLQTYGIREVARTGCVAMTRGTTEINE